MINKYPSISIASERSATDRQDPLGLTVTNWAEIARIASQEAIDSAHAAGYATTWEGEDCKIYQTQPDGTIEECLL
jgi:hypothetical protein